VQDERRDRQQRSEHEQGSAPETVRSPTDDRPQEQRPDGKGTDCDANPDRARVERTLGELRRDRQHRAARREEREARGNEDDERARDQAVLGRRHRSVPSASMSRSAAA
jgi:hypothetical protein